MRGQGRAATQAKRTRWIDLRIGWSRQYQADLGRVEAAGMGVSLDVLEGYLGAVTAAFIDVDGTESGGGPSISAAEAEFPGRILATGVDGQRWREEEDGLTWAVLCLGGESYADAASRPRSELRGWLERGVRVVCAPTDVAGCAIWLELATELSAGLAFDFAPLPSEEAWEPALSWLESESGHGEWIRPVVRGGGARASGVRLERLVRLGGLIALEPAELERLGSEGLSGWLGTYGTAASVASGFLCAPARPTSPGFGTAEQIAATLGRWLRPEDRRAILVENARTFLHWLIRTPEGAAPAPRVLRGPEGRVDRPEY